MVVSTKDIFGDSVMERSHLHVAALNTANRIYVPVDPRRDAAFNVNGVRDIVETVARTSFNTETRNSPLTSAAVAPILVSQALMLQDAAPVYDSKKTASPTAHPSAAFATRASRTAAGTDILIDAAAGNYSQVGSGIAMATAFEAAQTKAGESALTKGLQVLGVTLKKVPALGAVVTAGTGLFETGSNLFRAEWGRAGTALVAGVAETGGSIFGFGAGDVAREVTREGLIYFVGEKYAPEKASLRQIGENAVQLIESRNIDMTVGTNNPASPYMRGLIQPL